MEANADGEREGERGRTGNKKHKRGAESRCENESEIGGGKKARERMSEMEGYKTTEGLKLDERGGKSERERG